MNKKIATLALVGVMALGGTVAAYAATTKTVEAASNTSSKAISEDQSKDKADQDKETNDDQELTAANTKTAITEDQAKQTALASVTGGVFKQIELEDEDGVVVYGVEIQSGNNTYDVKVDANTGVIVKSDQDKNENEKSKIEKESNNNQNDSAENENQNDDPNESED